MLRKNCVLQDRRRRGARILLLGVLFAEVEDFEKGSSQALSARRGEEVDEGLVKAVKDDQGGFTADGVQHVIHHDR